MLDVSVMQRAEPSLTLTFLDVARHKTGHWFHRGACEHMHDSLTR